MLVRANIALLHGPPMIFNTKHTHVPLRIAGTTAVPVQMLEQLTKPQWSGKERKKQINHQII